MKNFLLGSLLIVFLVCGCCTTHCPKRDKSAAAKESLDALSEEKATSPGFIEKIKEVDEKIQKELW